MPTRVAKFPSVVKILFITFFASILDNKYMSLTIKLMAEFFIYLWAYSLHPYVALFPKPLLIMGDWAGLGGDGWFILG